jgi:UDP-N-acetylmuramate--alanine ligase
MNDPRPWRRRHLHFIGVGGSGMSGLAEVSVRLGATVTGSDGHETAVVARLRDAGISVSIGHLADNVVNGVEIVYSSAVPAHNVERRRAAELGLPQIRRGDLLAQVTPLKRCVAVAGAHGKTTVASMIAHVLRTAGLSPSWIVGADMRDGTPRANWGDGEWLVVETDESDGTFLAIRPDVAVLTNIDLEHTDHYATRDEVEAAFAEFVAGAAVVVTLDAPDTRAVTRGRASHRVAIEGVSLDRAGSRFIWRGITVALSVPGEHNVRNALVALEACAVVGVRPEVAVAALAEFPGARRRLELIGTSRAGARIYEDYAHHATEIRASLAAIRTIEPSRVVAVFEPHLFSRTIQMADDYGSALASADGVVVLEIFAAREAYVDHVDASGCLVASSARVSAGGRPVMWAPTRERAREYLLGDLGSGDVCLIMGVGPESAVLARELVPTDAS